CRTNPHMSCLLSLSTTFVLSLQRCDSSTNGTLYKYQARTLNGSCTVNLSDYQGKSVLIVNVATY
uniref:Uncharacterized protein n=1 Tax=Acanthochromis polyacanthus TaxID=80966 RepID=A0A3Q1FDQ4_9TELE